MSGFEYTPTGMVPMGPAQVALDALPKDALPVRPSIAKPAPSSPRDVVKLARARLRDVEREIKRLKKLERERDELRRLLAAATNKPRAVVRDIKPAQRG